MTYSPDWSNPAIRDARLATLAPRVPWDKFLSSTFDPRPGEHVAVIGPTGQGKTVLLRSILPFWPFVTAFATKPMDQSVEDLLIKQDGYLRMAKWRRLNPHDFPRRVLWPDARQLDSVDRQRDVFEYALKAIFREGGRPKHKPVGWAVNIDELWYIHNMLGLGKEIRLFLLQARSLGHSLLVGTQRPYSVPVEVYDQSTHLFFFADNDRRNLDRLSEVNARNTALVRAAVANLEPHQVLYINTRTGAMVRTRVPHAMAA